MRLLYLPPPSKIALLLAWGVVDRNDFLLAWNLGASGNGLKRSHLGACRKGSIEDYYAGLSRLQEQPAEAFLSVPAPLCEPFRCHSQARCDLAPGSALGAQGGNLQDPHRAGPN